MTYLDWHVGTKVVCINNAGEDAEALDIGRVYTIACIYEVIDGTIFVDLAEVSDSGWFPWRFRPVQTRASDISIFTAMLTKTKVPA